jgi:hypothetical protein
MASFSACVRPNGSFRRDALMGFVAEATVAKKTEHGGRWPVS